MVVDRLTKHARIALLHQPIGEPAHQSYSEEHSSFSLVVRDVGVGGASMPIALTAVERLQHAEKHIPGGEFRVLAQEGEPPAGPCFSIVRTASDSVALSLVMPKAGNAAASTAFTAVE